MNSKERMRISMAVKEADRVPVMCQLSIGHYFLNSGLDSIDIWCSSEGFSQALIGLRSEYGFDGILVNLPGRHPGWSKFVSRIIRSDELTVVRWKTGDQTYFPADDSPRVVSEDVRVPEFGRLDPEALFYVEPWGLGPIPYPYRWDFGGGAGTDLFPDYQLNTLRMVSEAAGKDFSIHAEVFSPWSQFLELLGIEQGLLAIYDDPGKVKACLEVLTDGAIALGRLQSELPIDAILISSAFAGAGFISRQHYSEFVKPFEARLVSGVKEKKRVPVYTHTCGKIGDRLDLMLETGTDGVDTLDPPPLGSVELKDAKAQLQGRAFIKGNMDPVNVLLKGSVSQVMKDAEERIRIGKPGGGFILSSACSVAPRTPAENLRILHQVAEAQGSFQKPGGSVES